MAQQDHGFLQAEREKAVGQLAGGVAHDFNNILLLIASYSEKLLSQIPEGDPCYQTVVAIREAGKRAANLTRQLQALSQHRMPRGVTVDLNEMILRVRESALGAFPENVIVIVKLSDSAANVVVDPQQFEQVLITLLQHARQAMPDGGWLTLQTRHEVHTDRGFAGRDLPPGPYLCLTATDTGPGMTDDVKARIFEPYAVRDLPGGGLSMAAMRGAVCQCGGSISVTSSAGCGTTFEIRLPAAPGQAAPARLPIHDASVSAGRTILLVEDEARLREILATTLELQGHRVLVASHGPGAIAVACRHDGPIDVLLTDVEMPEMSGHELAMALRAEFPRLPTVFMSGSASLATLELSMNPADRLLQKPFKLVQLHAAINEVLGFASATTD